MSLPVGAGCEALDHAVPSQCAMNVVLLPYPCRPTATQSVALAHAIALRMTHDGFGKPLTIDHAVPFHCSTIATAFASESAKPPTATQSDVVGQATPWRELP